MKKKIISLHLLKNSETPLIESLPFGGKSKQAVTVPEKGGKINLGAFIDKEAAVLDQELNVVDVKHNGDNIAQVYISLF